MATGHSPLLQTRIEAAHPLRNHRQFDVVVVQLRSRAEACRARHNSPTANDNQSGVFLHTVSCTLPDELLQLLGSIAGSDTVTVLANSNQVFVQLLRRTRQLDQIKPVDGIVCEILEHKRTALSSKILQLVIVHTRLVITLDTISRRRLQPKLFR